MLTRGIVYLRVRTRVSSSVGHMGPGDTIGERLRRLRTMRGMAQDELAERAGLSRDLIAKLEQGRRTSIRLTSATALASALDVELSALTDGRALVGEQRGVLALRRALTGPASFPGIDSSDLGDPTPIGELVGTVDATWADYWAGNFTKLGTTLPALIGEVRLTTRQLPTGQRPAAFASLSAVYQIAACVLTQLGMEDLGYLTVERALAAAGDSGDQLRTATLMGSLSWVLLNQGRFDEAERTALHTVDDVEPSLTKASVEHVSVWGSLLLTALAATAARGDTGRADEILPLARAAGGRVGVDRNDYETYFGPAKVATESVHAAVKLNDPAAALGRARDVPGDGAALPTAARGRHWLDVAQAQVDTRQYGSATETLLAAEWLSPEWMRHQVLAGTLVGELVERHRRLPAGLKGLASRLSGGQGGQVS